MSVFAGIILLFMAGLTFLDVVLRYFAKPIVGTYELVSFLGVAVVAFALPRASLMGAHVYVDLLIDKVPGGLRKTFRVITRLLVLLLFFFAAWYLAFMAKNFAVTKTVTMTLKVPFYPVVFALAASSLIQCLVAVFEIIEELRRKP
jgi:TRAP-type C4-dicarboxylate transport system permease small subunit